MALLLVPAAADARRDDKPTELFRPADGAVVKDARKGLKVDFSCPAYHQDVYDFVTPASDGYHVTLSSSPDIDAYGALAPAGIVDVRGAVLLPKLDEHCESELNRRGEALLPLEPGTYWWQASRDCMTYVCPGGIEVSFVNQVVVRRTVCSDLRSQSSGARRSLSRARKDLHRRPHSRARRARVARLSTKVAVLRERMRVAYGCRT